MHNCHTQHSTEQFQLSSLFTSRQPPQLRCCLSKRLLESKHTHTHPFNGPFSRTTQVSRYQKGKTNLDFTEASDSQWQWHQQGHMQVCTLLQTDNHTSTPPLCFLQAGCPSCRPTNSVKALKAVCNTCVKITYVDDKATTGKLLQNWQQMAASLLPLTKYRWLMMNTLDTS